VLLFSLHYTADPQAVGQVKNGDKMNDKHLKNFTENISKTGFCLEFQTSQTLRDNGWTVINNKYYIDDQQPTVREIDLVAYKARQMQHFWVYTALIISCKKSEQNIWALLSKEIDHKDPNIDWRPLHIWSNDKALDYMTSQSIFKNNYFDELAAKATPTPLRLPEYHVFAFQEMNKESGKPQNDKHIFDSVTSLMKAQAYELDALSHRKTTPVIYQFNLLSVIDTDLIRLNFTKSAVEAIPEINIDYVANYIVSKKETFAKIHFIKSGYFQSILAQYSNLHETNCMLFDDLCNNFYNNAVQDADKQKLFIKQFLKDLLFRIRIKLNHKFGNDNTLESTWLYWHKETGILSIQIDVTENEIHYLNSEIDIISSTKTLLKKHFRYEGPFNFVFDDDIPF
jgi:hypothetical protein